MQNLEDHTNFARFTPLVKSSRVSISLYLPPCHLIFVQYCTQYKSHYCTFLRSKLHRFQVLQFIDFKRCLITCKALHGLASGYIYDYCVKVSTN